LLVISIQASRALIFQKVFPLLYPCNEDRTAQPKKKKKKIAPTLSPQEGVETRAGILKTVAFLVE
jgi:hypothetical protein